MKSVVFIPLLLVAPLVSPASACDEYQKSHKVVSIGAVGDGQHRSVEIRVDNGKVIAKVDGKPVGESQIRREGDRIVILDANGKPMEGVPQVTMTDSAGAVVKFGDQQMSADEIVIDGEHGQLRLGARIRAEVDKAIREVDQAVGQAGQAGEVIRQYFIDSGLADRARTWLGDANATQAKAPTVMLGVTLQDPDPALRRQLGLEEGQTTLLIDVVEGLPADKAGLESYDLVVEVDGRKPADPDTIRRLLAERNPGDTLALTVRGAGGDKRTVEVTLEPFDRERLGSSGVFEVQGEELSDGVAPLLNALRGQLRMAPLDAQRGDFLFELRVPPGGDPQAGWSGADPGAPRPGLALPGGPGGPRAPRSMQPAPAPHSPGAMPGAGDAAQGQPAWTDEGAARLDQLEQRLDEMSRRLERLMEKLERSAR